MASKPKSTDADNSQREDTKCFFSVKGESMKVKETQAPGVVEHIRNPGLSSPDPPWEFPREVGPTEEEVLPQHPQC